jgi:hypothetical protein
MTIENLCQANVGTVQLSSAIVAYWAYTFRETGPLQSHEPARETRSPHELEN